jgi:seryl-tRNA synthetase
MRMLDLKFIRENPELVKAGAAKKNQEVDIDNILSLDAQRRELISRVEKLKASRNQASAEIAQKKKAGEPADDAITAMREVGRQISDLDVSLREVEERLNRALTWVPNLPHESVPVGDESANEVVREWGEIPAFDYHPLPHWELGERLNILDLPAAAKVSGSGFYVLKGVGARLQRALVNYMLDLHTADGFTELAVPHIVTGNTTYGTGQLPKMEDDMYKTEGDGLYLVPTAEVPITNIYKNEILNHDLLPICLVGHTPCYRREAGAAGKDTRGMIRVHQFDKVEMVKIVRPETSYDELETLLTQAEKVIRGLGLPYRVSNLATGDLTFASAKCYDIELWAAGVEKYLEVSSVANFEDFQARRMNCRFRDEDRAVKFPHTLNGSGVALPRLIIALLENYQKADGTVVVPEALRPYMQGTERIR